MDIFIRNDCTGGAMPVAACIARRAKHLSEAGLVIPDMRIVASRNKRSHLESTLLIALVVLKRHKVPFHSISFDNLNSSKRYSSFLHAHHFRRCFLSNAYVQVVGESGREVDAVTFAYAGDH